MDTKVAQDIRWYLAEARHWLEWAAMARQARMYGIHAADIRQARACALAANALIEMNKVCRGRWADLGMK